MAPLRMTTADFARRGFADPQRALDAYEAVSARHPSQEWIGVISECADRDLAMRGILMIDEVASHVIADAFADLQLLARLSAILGSSIALNEHLRAHPGDVDILRGELDRWEAERIHADIAAAENPDALRLANKRHLVRIAARDLTCPEPTRIVDDIAGELSDLADAVMARALSLAVANVDGHEAVHFAIVALGKCGAREVNYLSDIDVLYLAEPVDDSLSDEAAMRIATEIAAATSRLCSAHTAAGTIWQVDAALRPEGKAGPLVRTLASHRSYYEKWAENWEFQAMLKARPMAGDLELGQAFCDMVSPMIWAVGGKPNFMAEIQAMRARVVSLINPKIRDREIKLGAGGLRDVEFTVQLLQLVHGRVDKRLRSPATLPALTSLVDHGYIGRVDGAKLDEAYRFERVLEHRQQLYTLRRTHLMPDRPADLDRLARQVGSADGATLWDEWRALTRSVRALQQRVFYSPLLETVSQLSGDAIRLTPQAAGDRLHALGFSDPASALRHIEALTKGLTRTADIQRHLMPAMLSWFSQGPNPDLGLLEFRRLSETMGSTSWYMRALRDAGWMAERLARLLAASRYISTILRNDPSVVQMMAGDDSQTPRSRDDLTESLRRAVDRHEDDPDAAVTAIRTMRRRELFRLASIDVLVPDSFLLIAQGLTDLAGASLQVALELAARQESCDVPVGVVAMGRWGGGEMGYASDADAMFIVPDDTDHDGIVLVGRVISRARKTLGGEFGLPIDADLRPEGRNGPLIRTLSGYVSYYDNWGSTWERQALLRAGYGAGDRGLVDALCDGVAQFRYPSEVSDAQVAEIRRLKGRMERERTKRATVARNLKLGPGGLSDVEWTVQLLQLRHALEHPELRVTSTLDALDAATGVGLITSDDAQALRQAWTMASELRNSAMLVRGKSGDLLPTDPREIASVAMLLGYQQGQASAILENWNRAARHATGVVDRLFWGGDD